MTDKQR